eukprot:35640_1
MSCRMYQTLLLHCLLYFTTLIFMCGAAGGPYPASFDCPMRQLALEFAQNIQPHLCDDQLQEIADALNGSPEARNCSVSPQYLPFKPKHKHRMPSEWKDNDTTIPTIYVSQSPDPPASVAVFKSLQLAVDYARETYGPTQPKKIIVMEGTYYLDDTLHLSAMDSNLIISNENNAEVIISGAVLLNHLDWKLYNDNRNLYYTFIDTDRANISDGTIEGLRVNGKRAIRARYPNANPETDGFGSTLLAKQWIPPTTYNPLPRVWLYPEEPLRNMSVNGLFEHYNLGIGGYCDAFFDPPAGYWCSSFVQGGMAYVYRVPSGLIYDETDLPNAPYDSNVSSRGIVHTWQKAHWASWMFEIDKYDDESQSIVFGRGGFQGARGNDEGKEYYVENIFEEVDAPNEWFYNDSTQLLYYYKNGSSNVSEVRISQEVRVLQCITSHCMPSGGDWALQRTGAIILDGTEAITITDNLFTRLDGIAVSINRYNRNISIFKNEFAWIGDTVIAAMGDTTGVAFEDSRTEMGFDGTNGNQPRFVNISLNYVHELGIWEKQSSFYFAAKSCDNLVYANVFYNGPRAGININDGFGGNTNISRNLLFNTCRESGDHGPINTWDRQVYVSDGESVVKAYDYVSFNFLLSNYNAIWSVDNDDGSSYYSVFSNFEVYATGGLKSIWGGHNIHHFDNIFAYVQQQCFVANIQDEQLNGYNDLFVNNICILNDKAIKNEQYGAFGPTPCNVTQINQWPILANNTIYLSNVHNQTQVNNVGLCGMQEKEFQSKYNYDIGTAIYGANSVNDSDIINRARQMLLR